jgi:hypothetical protein
VRNAIPASAPGSANRKIRGKRALMPMNIPMPGKSKLLMRNPARLISLTSTSDVSGNAVKIRNQHPCNIRMILVSVKIRNQHVGIITHL